MADEYLPVDEVSIPHDGLKSVVGSSFNFRTPKIISNGFFVDDDQCRVKDYNHIFLLQAQGNAHTPVARLWPQDEKLQMVVYISTPVLQFYSDNFLGGTSSRGLDARGDWQGLTLESEFLPDSPNHPEWRQPDCFLRPGEEYASMMGYQFIPVWSFPLIGSIT